MENQNTSAELARKLRLLEERVAELESRMKPSDREPEPGEGSADASKSWIEFSGEVHRDAQELTYEWKRPVSFLMNQQWERSLRRISTLAHPVRGAILRKLLDSSCTVSDLVEADVVTSTGAAYHHLNELANGGWVAKDALGHYVIPPARVVPLFALIAAAEDH